MHDQRDELQEVDEVERMRRVRSEIEQECKTTAGFFDWLQKIERERAGRQRKRRTPPTKRRARRRPKAE